MSAINLLQESGFQKCHWLKGRWHFWSRLLCRILSSPIGELCHRIGRSKSYVFAFFWSSSVEKKTRMCPQWAHSNEKCNEEFTRKELFRYLFWCYELFIFELKVYLVIPYCVRNELCEAEDCAFTWSRTSSKRESEILILLSLNFSEHERISPLDNILQSKA